MQAEGLVAEETVQALANVAQELASTEQQLRTLLHLLHDPDTLAALPPLHRAATFLSLSKALNALFSLHLRCKGLSPDDHLASSEVERVSLYDSKVGHFIDNIKAPKHPTTVLDVQAANRFIEHAIPDLTEEQRKDIRDINRQSRELKHGSRKSRNLPDRPVKPVRMQSITEAAAAFLEEAKKDLLEEQKREGEVE